jgi:hypothetical protein
MVPSELANVAYVQGVATLTIVVSLILQFVFRCKTMPFRFSLLMRLTCDGPRFFCVATLAPCIISRAPVRYFTD